MNIVFDCNDRLGRRIIMLESGAAYMEEAGADLAPAPFCVVHSKVAVDVLSFMLQHQLGLEDLKKLVKPA